MKNLTRQLRSIKGQGTIEYALATVVVITILLAFIATTNNPIRVAIDKAWQKTADSLDG